MLKIVRYSTFLYSITFHLHFMSHIGRSFMLMVLILFGVAFLTATKQGREVSAQITASLSSFTADLFGK